MFDSQKSFQAFIIGMLLIIVGLIILNATSQSNAPKIDSNNAVTNAIDKTFCVSLSQGNADIEGSIQECMLEAKAERQQRLFL